MLIVDLSVTSEIVLLAFETACKGSRMEHLHTKLFIHLKFKNYK